MQAIPTFEGGTGGGGPASSWVAPGPPPSPSRLLRNLIALEQAPAFFALSDHRLRRLARRLRVVEVAAGTRLVGQGATGDCVYLVEQGACAVVVEVEAGNAVTVARLGAGDVCGEAAALGQPSPVTVVCQTAASVLALDLPALRSVLPEGSTEELELRRLVARRLTGYRELAARVRWSVPTGDATVIAVYAPKGGSGRTTIALNLAAQLAQRRSGDVLLVDLDFPHNQAALLSGLTPTASLASASAVGADLDEALLSAAQLHPSGYMVLAGATRVEESELVSAEQVTRALRALKGAFRYIVVDLGIALSDAALSVFDLAHHVVLVITPELPSLKGGRDVTRVLTQVLHVPEDRLTVVLNQRQARAVVPRDALETTLGRPPAVEVGHDGNKPERAALAGNVLAATDPKSEIAKGTRRLAELLTSRSKAHEAPE